MQNTIKVKSFIKRPKTTNELIQMIGLDKSTGPKRVKTFFLSHF